MALAQEDVDFIKAHLPEWLREAAPRPVFERELLERVIKVEEELAHQRDLIQQGFARVDARFEDMNKRFEAVDRRFDEFYMSFRELNRRIDRFMVWSFGLTLTVGGMVIVILRLWPPGP